jgi:cytidine deaminase
MQPEEASELVALARAARSASYSPYSGVRIGAAVLCGGGKLFAGCNVENSSFGLSCCAERSAIFRAVSEGSRDILALAVVGESEGYTRPCGACRQVMLEFNPAMSVLMRGEDGFSEDSTAEALMPHGFRPGGLPRR